MNLEFRLISVSACKKIISDWGILGERVKINGVRQVENHSKRERVCKDIQSVKEVRGKQ